MPNIEPGSVWLFGRGDDREVVVVDRVDGDTIYFTDGGCEYIDEFHPPEYTILFPPDLFSDIHFRSTPRSPHPGIPPVLEPIRRRGNLLFTIGIARSGKSTWCTRWSQHLEDPTDLDRGLPLYPRAIVCGDDIRLAVHGERFNKDAEPVVWAIHTYMVKALLSRGHDVVIDGTNTTADSIWRILNADVNAQFRLFDVDPEECKRRARECGHDDLVDRGVIDRQHGQLCDLKAEDGGVAGVVDSVRARVKSRWGVA